MTETQFDPETGEIIEPAAPHLPAKKTGPGKKANGKSRIPADETKRQKFVRLVDPRVVRAITAIRRIGKLGGRNAGHYEYGEEDVGKIVEALSREIVQLEKTMIRGKPAAPVFSIDD